MAKDRWDQYDETAANNTDIDGASLVDSVATVDSLDTIFQNFMQDTAQWLADNNGSNSTAGSSNAYTYAASAQTFTAYFTGLTLTLQANHTNTGAATLDVDSIGAKAIRRYANATDVALAAGDIAQNDIVSLVYDANANSSAGAWMMLDLPYAGRLRGTNTNDTAATGHLGEYVEATVAIGSAGALSSGVPGNMSSISLSAGDWEVTVVGHFKGLSAATVTDLVLSAHTTSATLSTAVDRLSRNLFDAGESIGTGYHTLHVGPARFSVSGTTEVYAVASATFSAGSVGIAGIIRARRVR